MEMPYRSDHGRGLRCGTSGTEQVGGLAFKGTSHLGLALITDLGLGALEPVIGR